MVAEFSFIIIVDTAQYIRLISFTPAANKPGELCRIKRLGIEIGFAARCKKLSCQTQFQLLQIRFLKVAIANCSFN